MNASLIEARIAKLRNIFYRHERQDEISERFDQILWRRRAEIEQGQKAEAREIAIIGASGSGKSTAVGRLLNKHPALQLPTEGKLEADVISFQVPSPATLKDVGYATLHAIGYPLNSDKSAGIIWNRVKDMLHKRKTLFLHIDEAQDLYTVRGDQSRQNVVNTLKSIMQNRDWPVGIVLSGMPQTRNILNRDPQLSRRIYPIDLKPLSFIADEEMIRDIICSYVCKGELSAATSIVGEAFLRRFLHAGAYELGLTIELVIEAVGEAYRSSSAVLEAKHFVRAFRRQTACIDGLNPFVVDDFESIDPRKLLGRDFDEEEAN